jgi:hypothetical protein
MCHLIAWTLMYLDAKIVSRRAAEPPTWLSDRLWDLALAVTRRRYPGFNMEVIEEIYWTHVPHPEGR